MKKIIMLLFVLSLTKSVFSCDMFALLAKEGGTLALPDTSEGEFDDVTDFFNFIKVRSDENYQDDGYGVIYYKAGESIIRDNQKWFKTGYNTWYGDGNYDPLDDAIPEILNSDNNAVLTMVHARNGTGANGSHPFLFDYNGKTYSFMHNGAISNQIKEAIINYLGEDWFQNHDSNWFGVYPNSSTFIDSELLFHYIMESIIHENDTFAGIKRALNNRNLFGIDFKEKIGWGSLYSCSFMFTLPPLLESI